ncbi:MAG: hypothetical protein JW782_04655 [Candidatus Saganbacteria bacterium]|nr:hypothetical protein [Candidatus Saganbacteria bacterium]
MFNKLSLLAVLGLMVTVISSCGVRTETNYYYYSPSWTRGGALIFIGATDSVEKDILGSQLSSTYSEWVKTIYPSGTGESSVLFDSSGNPPYAMTCSPTGDYVAYGNDLRSGLYRTLVIRNISSGTHTGMELTELAFNPGVVAFDWSSDGTKLVYCTSTEVRTVGTDGSNDTLVTAEANLADVTWKYGNRIAFVRASGGSKLLSLIRDNGTNRTDLSSSESVDLPQISASNADEIYGVSSGDLVMVDVGGVPARSVIKADFPGVLPRLSPDAATLTYSKSSESTGIYVLNIATGAETKVK